MKKPVLLIAVAVALLLLPACSRHYVIRMNNGVQLTTSSKPKLKAGSYYFKDASGREQSIPQGRVQQIAPASRAEEDNKQFFRSRGS